MPKTKNTAPTARDLELEAAFKRGYLISFYKEERKKDRLSDEDKSAIEACVIQALEIVKQHLPFEFVSIGIATHKGGNSHLLPVTGGGGLFGMALTFDPDHPVYHFPDQHKFVTSAVAHELHHSERSHHHLHWGTSDLKEALVSEGAAVVFDEEIVGEMPFIARVVNNGEFLAREDWVKKHLSASIYSHDLDDFEERHNLPQAFVYGFAYNLIKAWKKHSGQSAVDIVSLDANEIIQPWLDGKFSIADAMFDRPFLPTTDITPQPKPA